MPQMTAETLVERMKGILFERCPKCGVAHPRIIKGGKTSTGETFETISNVLGVNIATAFRMRHKLMCSLEDEEASAR
ncbi:MAG: hypothetical protein EOM67_14550, partial [Spirochaetia bacterium]|nr:hypothetical protein [Spirochaetia bacterium]